MLEAENGCLLRKEKALPQGRALPKIMKLIGLSQHDLMVLNLSFIRYTQQVKSRT
jgi:hypothetical protein